MEHRKLARLNSYVRLDVAQLLEIEADEEDKNGAQKY
jgi:hypothetical protein